MAENISIEEQWRLMLSGNNPKERRNRHLFGLLPKDPRCRLCNAPFHGVGSIIMKTFFKKERSRVNPNFCNACENFASKHRGGAEIELSMLFADVRGSTSLAERISPGEFTNLMNRFYDVTTDVLVRTDAFIDKLVGDEVIGFYIPGFAGPDHARISVEAAKELLLTTGHADRNGPWLPVGVGVHTGKAFYGAIGTKDRISDVTALGDAVNITARLAQQANAGEILITESTCAAGKINLNFLERRRLELKGRSEPVDVRVLRVNPS